MKDGKIKRLAQDPEKKSYEEFIAEAGLAAEADISLSAAADRQAQARLRAPEAGASGEALARDGLSSSGYADYLRHSLKDELNADYAAAIAGAATQDYSRKSSYGRYIASYDASQKTASEGIVERLVSGGIFDKDYAYRLAKEAGLSEENAIFTAARGVNKAKQQAILDAIKYAKKNDLYAYNAKSYALRLGLDERSAELVYNAIRYGGYGDAIDYESLTPEKYIQMLKDRLEEKD